MKRLFVVLIMAGVATLMSAQPSKRRVTTSNAIATQANANASTGSGTDRGVFLPDKPSAPCRKVRLYVRGPDPAEH